MKKILTFLIASIMILSLAACGGGSGDESASDASDPAASESSAESSSRDETFELSNEAVTCIIEYDSSRCDTYDYEREDIKYFAYISSDIGSATIELTQGSASADAYIESFKEEKHAGDYSDYYVKDLVVEPLDTCEVNGYTYYTYTYSYKDVYVNEGHEYDNYGTFGYVQLTDDMGILIEEPFYDDWEEFVESMLYIKEVK